MVGFGGRVVVRLENQLSPVRLFGRDDCQPSVFARADIGLLNKTQRPRIEVKRLDLIVYKYTC